MKNFIVQDIKDINRRTVLDLIIAKGEISRTRISSLTGISAPTVLKITGHLLENGFIVEAGEAEGTLGRKPMLLKFNPDVAHIVGVHYEGDYLKVGLVDLSRKIKDVQKIEVKSDFDTIVNEVIAQETLELIKRNNIPRESLLGLGLGLPGVVNDEKTEIEFGPLVGIDSTRPFRQTLATLERNVGMPVHIYNDVNAAAIGEYVERGKKDKDMLYISLGTGLGAGIIMDNKIRKGANFTAGEIGYMVFEKDYETSKFSPGWLESTINLRYILEEFGNQGEDSQDRQHILAHISDYLGICIANSTTLLDIDNIVLGGELVDLFGDALVKATRRKTEQLCLGDVKVTRQICNNPGIIGAASMVADAELDAMLAGRI